MAKLRVEIVSGGVVQRVFEFPDPRDVFCREFNSIYPLGDNVARVERVACGRSRGGQCRRCKTCAHRQVA